MLFKRLFLYLITCLSFVEAFAQKNENYDLIAVRVDHSYMNFVQYENKLYIGTNDGALEINPDNNAETLISDQKGYIMIENKKISGNKLNGAIAPDESRYNYLLPKKYYNTTSRSTLFNKQLYIINNGTLFIFKKNNYTTTFDSLSVRSITQHYIGSYQGIFKDGIKLKYPEFTDGNIREFDNETFICYGGIYRDSSGIVTIYNNIKNGEVKIGKQELGSARDIAKLNNGNYVLVTNQGIYIVNFSKTLVINVETSVDKNEYFSLIKVNNPLEDNSRFYYSDSKKLYYYVVSTKEKVLLLDIENKGLIKDVYADNLSNIYVLFEDKLCKYTRNNKSYLYEETVFVDNLNFTHNLVLFNNIFCISTNVGFHLYDLKSNKAYLNIIPIETNRRSLFISKDTVKFGTVNGIINLSEEDINNLMKERDTALPKAFNNSSEIKNYIIYGLIVLIIGLVIIGIRLYKRRESKNIELPISNLITKEQIVQYIYNNITDVTIQSICDKYNLTPVRLYDILENDKPGEIIRNHRLNLVRRFRREKKDDQFIAENTGFSVSYLKKIY